MHIIAIQAFGVLTFVVGSLWLARMIRHAGHGRVTERASRISHGLFWIALVLPGIIGLFHPGLATYDRFFGVPGFPWTPLWIANGATLLVAGLALLVSSNLLLAKMGRGAAAFHVTQQLVNEGLYGRTRNPMSLGFYAACLGTGTIARSLTVTLGALLLVIPAHVINLKCFEERELELRYGRTYVEYRQRVPFLFPRFKRTSRVAVVRAVWMR